LQLRVTKATIPGSTIPMEFLEFKNVSRKPMQAANRDPGTALLHYTVRDIDAMVGQLKAAGATVISNGGVPVTDSGNDRVIILRDPNNFFIDLHQKPKNIG
jgi:predicted enzyme related to lactoylglutathione lyase